VSARTRVTHRHIACADLCHNTTHTNPTSTPSPVATRFATGGRAPSATKKAAALPPIPHTNTHTHTLTCRHQFRHRGQGALCHQKSCCPWPVLTDAAQQCDSIHLLLPLSVAQECQGGGQRLCVEDVCVLEHRVESKHVCGGFVWCGGGGGVLQVSSVTASTCSSPSPLRRNVRVGDSACMCVVSEQERVMGVKKQEQVVLARI
jgi:hypothetical protein